jgi:hypothetical protein
MWRTMAAVLRAGAAVGVGIWLAVAAMNARPAGAQEFGFAAVAVSPSTLKAGSAKGTTTQASVGLLALQYCQESGGGNDCKVYSVMNGCVAVATQSNPVPNHYGCGTGPTRDGAAAEALAGCAKAGGIDCFVQQSPCSSDDVRWASPLPLPPGGKPGSVDPNLVGLWKLNVNSGIWVWQISVNGTYTFHSEAPDNTLPHNGTFTASNGHYTLHSIVSLWDDLGTYTYQASAGAVVMTGKLGTGTWYRIAADPGYVEPASEPASRR